MIPTGEYEAGIRDIPKEINSKPYDFYEKIYGWCVSKCGAYEGWGLLYWRIRERFKNLKRTVNLQSIPVYYSGFCSCGRGRHWDRRSRYGEK